MRKLHNLKEIKISMQRLTKTVMEELEKSNFVNFATFKTARPEVTAPTNRLPAALTIKDSKINLPKLSDSILEQLKCDVSIAVTRVREGSSTINRVSF